MSMQRMMVGAIWLLAGMLIVAISLVRGQREAVWGASEVEPPQVMTLKQGLLASGSAVGGGGEVILPGDWKYLVQVGHDWLWWRLAPDDNERVGRLLNIADDRLQAGWDLGERGEMSKAIETLTKAENYLSGAAQICETTTRGCEVVKREALVHEELLRRIELQVPDALRPKVTVLVNVPSGIR